MGRKRAKKKQSVGKIYKKENTKRLFGHLGDILGHFGTFWDTKGTKGTTSFNRNNWLP
jgi:hypothetical protein